MDIEKIYAFFRESSGVSTDTRHIPKGSIFFALKGANFNGNQFARQAITSGARYAIVDESEFVDEKNGIFLVKDVLTTLQKLAGFHRKKLNIPVIGLTGSNGKTTTKELMTVVLKQKYTVTATRGNLNNHIGVPLTLLSIPPDAEIAIVEMGANHQQEIEFLCCIAQPNFGYITNFGKAHLEGFGGVEGVIKGKSELYTYLKDNSQTVFVNCNDEKQLSLTENMKRLLFGNCDDVKFSFKYKENNDGLCPEINYKSTAIQSPLVGSYNAFNVAAALAVGLEFGVPVEKIKFAIENYQADNNRSQIIHKENRQIILDAYNANPSSMEAALRNFSLIKGEKAVILGDMFELGESSATEHQQVAELAAKLGFEQVFLIGERFSRVEISEKNIHKSVSKKEAIQFFKENPLSEKFLLIKGSRGMALEELLELF
ncbi:MAG: UDP-N-acetylmuramoyl-tripeptide--D-alanyl-D-alanine ligase [Weeksellaceae bacterium]